MQKILSQGKTGLSFMSSYHVFHGIGEKAFHPHQLLDQFPVPQFHHQLQVVPIFAKS